MENNSQFERPENSVESIEYLKQITIDSLNKALSVHDALGATGEETVEKNQFGDTALKGDIECEKAILNYLKENNIPIRVISEEHGQVDITENPRLLGILDGLDGSSVYKKERGTGRYATMFGIYDTIDPKYKDYLVSGIMEHSSKRLYIAEKGEGSFMIEGDVKTPIHSSGKTKLELDPKTNIYIDEAWDVNKNVFSSHLQEFKPASREFATGSSAIYYVDVASGAADLALECTRKNNLEIAVAYALETEAGAVMTDIDGVSLSDKKYLEFGQTEKLPVITAATQELAENLIQFLHK